MAEPATGLSQVRITNLVTGSPSMVCREITYQMDLDEGYRAEEAGKAARMARCRPKKRLLDCVEVLSRHVIVDLSYGCTPR